MITTFIWEPGEDGMSGMTEECESIPRVGEIVELEYQTATWTKGARGTFRGKVKQVTWIIRDGSPIPVSAAVHLERL